MKEFFGKEAELLVIGAVTGVGVLVRLLLFGYYAGLGKACRAPRRTKNRTMTYIRQDLKKREHSGEGIKNAALYTECRLAERRIGGIRLGVLECIWQQSLLMVCLCGVLAAFMAVFRRAEFGKVLFLLFVSGLALFGLLLLDLFGGIKEKSNRARLCIREYIENGFTNRTEEEAEPVTHMRKEAKREKKERRRERKAEKKEKKEAYCADKLRKKEEKKSRREERKSARIAKRGKRKGKAQEEKRRLTEELLRERRQLEARSLAEQRRKEREEQEEEIAENRAEAEAAVTECPEHAVAESGSYEELLSGVLAEYLA